MKTFFTFSFFLLCAFSMMAQVSITPQQTAQNLVNKIVATSSTLGVTTSNASLNCFGSANAEFTGSSNLGINDGIIIGTGLVPDILGLPTVSSSNVLNAGGDSLLGTLVNSNTYDACVLEFDIQPVGSNIEFEYVFGSDEYSIFNCSNFNDIFAFHISGPGISGMNNIALVPGTNIPVSINSINDQSNSSCGDSTYYVNNTDTFFTINGFTTPLIASSPVIAGATYHLRLAIADVSDAILNSYVALKANSLKSSGTPSSAQAIANAQGIRVYPTNIVNELILSNEKRQGLEYTIYTSLGQLVKKGTISKTQNFTKIPFDSLSQGIYFVKIAGIESAFQFTQKVIKQ